MNIKNLIFISFKPYKGSYIAFLSIEYALSSEKDIDTLLRESECIYRNAINKMKSLINEIQKLRSHRIPLPARKVWQIGNCIFELTENLAKLSLQIDGVYEHLERDLAVKRKWLEKAIILRRYILDEYTIPDTLNWGKCEKGTRQVAIKLQKGLPLD